MADNKSNYSELVIKYSVTCDSVFLHELCFGRNSEIYFFKYFVTGMNYALAALLWGDSSFLLYSCMPFMFQFSVDEIWISIFFSLNIFFSVREKYVDLVPFIVVPIPVNTVGLNEIFPFLFLPACCSF